MRKFLSPLKKNNKIFFQFVLFIIMILPLSQFIEAQGTENTPEFYEFYISQNGKKIEIPEMPTMLQSPIKAVSEPWSIPGINSRPKLVIIVEFLLHRPDGSIHARHKRILDFPKPGRIYSILQEFIPSNLLMPGKWVLGIKIYGELVKCIPFYVSTE